MSKRILIVEDEKNLARFVSLELQHEGYDVVTADNGREGLEMALEKDFDLILLDLMLPEMDGFEVTRRLQQEKDTYIMMMTARDSIMDIVAGLDRGADDYIVKLDVQNRTVVRGDEAIPLTKREFDLLNTLLSNMNQVMTREELLLQVWKYDDAIETNVVDVYIRYLRGKIDVPGKESYIQTVRGMGYVIREK